LQRQQTAEWRVKYLKRVLQIRKAAVGGLGVVSSVAYKSPGSRHSGGRRARGPLAASATYSRRYNWLLFGDTRKKGAEAPFLRCSADYRKVTEIDP
jgi:hypothetical protein